MKGEGSVVVGVFDFCRANFGCFAGASRWLIDSSSPEPIEPLTRQPARDQVPGFEPCEPSFIGTGPAQGSPGRRGPGRTEFSPENRGCLGEQGAGREAHRRRRGSRSEVAVPR